MSNNQCDCEACIIKQKYQAKEKEIANNRDSSWFKENTQNIYDQVEKGLEENVSLGKNKQNIKFYRISLTEYDNVTGACIEYSKEISNYDFAFLLDELFEIDFEINEEESEENTYEEDILVFKSLDEAIDYLKNKHEEDQ